MPNNLDLAMVTSAFYRALLAYNDFCVAAHPTQDQADRAAWAQQFFFRQGLMPTIRETNMAQYISGFKALFEYRDALRYEQALFELQNKPLTTTSQDIIARLNKPDAQVAIQFLKKIFASTDARGNVTPGTVSATVDDLRGAGRNSLERCKPLTEATYIMRTETLRSDLARQAAATAANLPRPHIYDSVALRAARDATLDQYEQATSAFETGGRTSKIYDRVVAMPAGQPQPTGLIYAVLPGEPAPVYGPLAPEPSGRFDAFQ